MQRCLKTTIIRIVFLTVNNQLTNFKVRQKSTVAKEKNQAFCKQSQNKVFQNITLKYNKTTITDFNKFFLLLVESETLGGGVFLNIFSKQVKGVILFIIIWVYINLSFIIPSHMALTRDLMGCENQKRMIINKNTN